MGKNILPIILPLVFVLLVSGCTQGGSGITTGNGVVIEAFEPDFRQIYSKEPVQLQIKVKNTGSVDAENIDVILLNLDDKEWGTAVLTGITSKSKLLAPDQDRGTQGGSSSGFWSLTAPELPKGLSTTYNPVARVSYKTRSTTIKSITLVPQAEARRLQNIGKTLPIESVSSTSSPITLDITTKGPIRVFDAGDLEFPLEVRISNVGGGTVCSDDCSDNTKWNKLNYAIDLPQGLSFPSGDCDSGSPKEITLFRGQTNTVTCNLKADSAAVVTQIQKQIKVFASYSYFTEGQTSLTVTGTKAAP